jgi:hypothetical protein
MIEHEVRAHPSSARLAREDQLAWKLAAVATDPASGIRGAGGMGERRRGAGAGLP